MHEPHARSRLAVVEALHDQDTPDDRKRVNRLADCCSFPMVVVGPDGRPRVTLARCRDRLCPLCQQIRSRESARLIVSRLADADSLRMLTLTLREDGRPLRERLDRLSESFRKLRRMKRWKTCVRGGVAALEITRGTNGLGWHCHLHVLADGGFYPQFELSEDWKAATGDSSIVDIRICYSRKTAASYVAKYVSKSASLETWSSESIAEFAHAMHRRRSVLAFGSCHAAKIEAGETPEERPQLRRLCSVYSLRFFAARGDAMARRAIEIGSQMGGWWPRVLGVDRVPADPQATVPVSLALEIELVDCCERVGLMAKGSGPVPRPPKPARVELPPRLFPDRHRSI